MINLLILNAEDKQEDVSTRIQNSHDLIIQETDAQGMFKILKSRVKTRRATANWPYILQLLQKTAEEVA